MGIFGGERFKDSAAAEMVGRRKYQFFGWLVVGFVVCSTFGGADARREAKGNDVQFIDFFFCWD